MEVKRSMWLEAKGAGLADEIRWREDREESRH